MIMIEGNKVHNHSFLVMETRINNTRHLWKYQDEILTMKFFSRDYLSFMTRFIITYDLRIRIKKSCQLSKIKFTVVLQANIDSVYSHMYMIM